MTMRGLIVDWGGVLTTALEPSMRRWAAADGIEFAQFQDTMRAWLGNHQGQIAAVNPVAALERGEMQVPRFEEELASRLAARSGHEVRADGLLQRMFDHFEHAPDMAGLVLRAHHAGIRTGLLSNSWGNDYPRDGWDEMFDAVVISGEVRMRKPEPDIFAHTLELLGTAASETVFVDDLRANIDAAADLGLVGVHHTSYETTAAELEALFGVPLAE